MSRSTVSRRLHDAEFQRLVSHYRKIKISQTLGLLSEAGPDAVEALHLIVIDDQIKADTRRQAAVNLLELQMQAEGSLHVDDRLRELEEEIGNARKPSEPHPEPSKEGAGEPDSGNPIGQPD